MNTRWWSIQYTITFNYSVHYVLVSLFSFQFANWFAHHPHLQFAICNCKSSVRPHLTKLLLHRPHPVTKCLLENCCILKMPQNVFWKLFYSGNALKCLWQLFILEMPPKYFLNIFFIANFSKCFFENWFRWKTLWILWEILKILLTLFENNISLKHEKWKCHLRTKT